MSPAFGRRLTKRVLLGPGMVLRAAANRAQDAEEAWMLGQPRKVRESYVREVLDGGEDPVAAEIWMLRQPNDVRESYVRDVLEPRLKG
jgi:hypothetical protein